MVAVIVENKNYTVLDSHCDIYTTFSVVAFSCDDCVVYIDKMNYAYGYSSTVIKWGDYIELLTKFKFKHIEDLIIEV